MNCRIGCNMPRCSPRDYSPLFALAMFVNTSQLFDAGKLWIMWMHGLFYYCIGNFNYQTHCSECWSCVSKFLLWSRYTRNLYNTNSCTGWCRQWEYIRDITKNRSFCTKVCMLWSLCRTLQPCSLIKVMQTVKIWHRSVTSLRTLPGLSETNYTSTSVWTNSCH